MRLREVRFQRKSFPSFLGDALNVRSATMHFFIGIYIPMPVTFRKLLSQMQYGTYQILELRKTIKVSSLTSFHVAYRVQSFMPKTHKIGLTHGLFS